MSSPDRVVSSKELQKELASLPAQKKFDTGFPILDEMSAGWREGDLVVLSGLSGVGKTQFAVSLIKGFSALDIPVLMFSYEISTQELFERFGEDVPVFYLPRIPASSAPSWIRRKIEEGIEKFGIKIVFIDHLHYLVDTSTILNRNSSEIIGHMVRELKTTARELRVCIVLICHVRKLSSKYERPHMADLRDSSNIGNEADLVLMLHRMKSRRKKAEEDDGVLISNDAWLYLDKVRHHGGRTGRIKYFFDDKGFYVEEEDF